MKLLKQKVLTKLNEYSLSQVIISEEYSTPQLTGKSRKVKTVFPLAFLLDSLVKLDLRPQWYPELVSLIKENRNANGTFNYNLATDLDKEQAIPNDLDDTSIATAALHSAGIKTIAEFFFTTIKIESAPGGPYYTWYLNEHDINFEAWKEIDPFVNANFLQCAARHDIKLSNLVEYLVNIIESGKFNSHYYPYQVTGYYFLSLYILHSKNKTDPRLKSLVSKYIKGIKPTQPTEKLFLELAKSNLGMNITKKTREYYQKLLTDNEIPKILLSTGYKRADKTTYVTNSALSLVLTAECSLPNKPNTEVKTSKKPSKSLNYYPKLMQNIRKIFDDYNVKLSQKLFKNYQNCLNLLQIAIKLVASDQINEDNKDLIDLGVYLLSSWGTYHILDDVLDGQKALSELPNANKLNRVATQYLLKLDSKIASKLLSKLDQTDDYYLWETTNARFSDFNKLKYDPEFDMNYMRQRITGLTATLATIPQILSPKAKYDKNLESFITDLLIIRQLNDDAKDWQEDMKSGIKTYVLNLLLKLSDTKDNLTMHYPKVLSEVINICEDLGKSARAGAKKLENSDFAEKILQQELKSVNLLKDRLQEYQKYLKLI